MFKLFTVLALGFVITGCSEPKPIDIDINEAAANAGLAPEDYKVNENGTIEVHSKVEQDITVDRVITAFKTAGLPVGEVLIQTSETDPNDRLGRPGEYIASAQFEDSRVRQDEPIPELDLDDDIVPLGGTIELFNNDKDLQARKQYIEQVYEMMPSLKQYMYVHKLGLLRLEYELTPEQAKEYEAAFVSL